MRAAVRGALLVVLWLLAWGETSVANILSGTAVAVALLVTFPPAPSGHSRVRLHPVHLPRLGGYVLRQLVVSNALMSVQIVRGGTHQPAVLAHQLRVASEQVVTVMTSIISLSPGTMTVDVDGASSIIYVHFFDLHDVDRGRRELRHLEDLVTRAIAPSPPVTNGEP